MYGQAAVTPSPGPFKWVSTINQYDEHVQKLVAADGHTVLECGQREAPQWNGDTANAKLLAAAPLLLAALNDIAQWAEMYTKPDHPIVTVARTAIRAATVEDTKKG